jgi:DNA-binding NtrC family response regulator
LPREMSLPALYKGAPEKDGLSERDILYKVLFDMKKDMNDLKKLVLETYAGVGKGNQLIKENPELFEGMEANDLTPSSEPVVLNLSKAATPINHAEEVHDITHETEDESLSIEKKEKELIIRALRKNNNRRKYAARDLGISERTLYRKIKQYDLED